ncbi:hypothetical protein PCASD_02400 [Puccinia coronata f. sp. avenae]|uniref:Uncharacterized protein n=1 Tax=Puccinia coronata f. sp. avenae TaxID=200324 RepID=A0A2N5VM40_9BASI|nr:hypothetical protein PCASD_02400 [Puccinia coronata f. sp. avenae]
MTEKPTIKPSAEVKDASFRSTEPDKHSEKEYLERFRKLMKVSSCVFRDKQVLFPPAQSPNRTPIPTLPNDISDAEDEIAKRLGLTLLPALQEKVRDLTIAMSPSNWKHNTISWLEAVLHWWFEFKQTLEEIGWSQMITVWRTRMLVQDNRLLAIHHLSPIGQKIYMETQNLVHGPIGDLFITCGRLFDSFGTCNGSSLSPIGDYLSLYETWVKIVSQSALTIETPDRLIHWL